MSPGAWWRRCVELRTLLHRLAYQGRHGAHPDPIASLLVFGIVVVSAAMMTGAWLLQPVLVG